MADTGSKVVTISQAARYLGKDVSGGIGDSVITLRQLRAMRDGSKATPTVLPSGYTELEYIESSGTQYIRLDFTPDSDTRVVLDHQLTDTQSTQAVLGSRTNSNATDQYCVYIVNGQLRTDYGSAIYPAFTASAARIVLDKDGRVTKYGTQTYTATAATFTCPRPMVLFSVQNVSGTAVFDDQVDNRPVKMRLYSCQIYDGDTLARDLVPARRQSDSAVGLYDTVTSTFYGNAGTGSFTAGPVVHHSADPRDGLVVRVSQLARIEIGPTIVSWSTGTDEEVAAMVAAADAGKINLSDYWSAGDTRTVHLSAMSASSGLGDTHAAQDVQFVLTDPGHYTLANGKACSFVVLQKDCLKESGVMNSRNTNSGGWNSCPRRTWCNSVYRNAIPATLRPIFKQFTTYAANGTGSTSTASSDYFALFSEKEVFGSTTYANSSAESKNSQLTWFKTPSNRIKRVNGSASYWWERSPYSGNSKYFCAVTRSGTADYWDANYTIGLAPFGCI